MVPPTPKVDHWLDSKPPQFQSTHQLLVLVVLLCQLFQVPSVRGVASFYQPYFPSWRPISSPSAGPALLWGLLSLSNINLQCANLVYLLVRLQQAIFQPCARCGMIYMISGGLGVRSSHFLNAVIH